MNGTVNTEELRKRVGGLRSLSGCFRLVQLLERNPLQISESPRKIALLTHLLTLMRELSGVDPQAAVGPVSREARQMLLHYVPVLCWRAEQRTVAGIDLGEAEADARQALHLARLLGSERLEEDGLNGLGNILMITQRTGEARQCFRAGVRLARQGGRHEELARSLYNLARACLALSALDEAQEAIDEALLLYDGHDLLPLHGKAFLYSVRQYVHESLDERGKALADGLRSLELFTEIGMEDRLVPAHYHLTKHYLALDRPSEAMNHAREATLLAEKTGTPADRIFSLLAMATVYIKIGEPEIAMAHAGKGLRLARAAGLREMEAVGLERVARIMGAHGEHRLAIDYLHEALGKEDRPLATMELHQLIASHWLDAGEPEEARRHIGKRSELRRDLNDSRVDGEFRLIQARLEINDGRLDCAVGLLRAVVDNANNRLAARMESHRRLSEIYRQLGDPDTAFEHYGRYHTAGIEIEKRIGAERLIALRTQHNVETHRMEAARAKELQHHIGKKNEELALAVSERQRVIDQARHEVTAALQCLNREATEQTRRALEEALRKLNSAPATGEQWLHHLPNIGSDFFDRLRTRYPALTRGQVRLCGLLRSGMSSSEIAQRLHVTLETVLTQRKRLRKRMSLKEGENLETALLQL